MGEEGIATCHNVLQSTASASTECAKDGSFRGLFGHPDGATGPLRVGINRTGRERRQMGQLSTFQYARVSRSLGSVGFWHLQFQTRCPLGPSFLHPFVVKQACLHSGLGANHKPKLYFVGKLSC